METENMKELPPEMHTIFLEDIANVVITMQDETDQTMLDATKGAIEMFMRSGIKQESLDSLYSEVVGIYKKEKQGRPNEDLLEKTNYFVSHAKELRKEIQGKTDFYIN